MGMGIWNFWAKQLEPHSHYIYIYFKFSSKRKMEGGKKKSSKTGSKDDFMKKIWHLKVDDKILSFELHEILVF